jgi:hypothetical protein
MIRHRPTIWVVSAGPLVMDPDQCVPGDGHDDLVNGRTRYDSTERHDSPERQHSTERSGSSRGGLSRRPGRLKLIHSEPIRKGV